MNSFEEWLKSITHPSVQKFSKHLIELGASWETFQREKSEVVIDLVDGGIPQLAAKDIFSIASDALSRSQVPLKVFWDLENMQIPANSSVAEVMTRLKAILSSHGKVAQIRGYATIESRKKMTEKMRSDLHLSGCTLADCPYKKKEVIDKMIIIDAMEFAFTYLKGATICFITDDMDFAYLLTKLQKPQWKTIVFSKGGMHTMSQLNCDIKIQWETEVLNILPLPPGFKPVALEEHRKKSSEMDLHTGCMNAISNRTFSSQNTTSNELKHSIIDVVNPGSSEVGHRMKNAWKDEPCSQKNTSNEVKHGITDVVNPGSLEVSHRVKNAWKDELDVKFLRHTVSSNAQIGDPNHGDGTLKSLVCSQLRQKYPVRFPDREILQQFISKAIENGAVIESNSGANKVLHLPEEYKVSAMVVPLSPIHYDEFPPRVKEMSSKLPFILFLKKFHIPLGETIPEKIFVQSQGKWMIIMFRSLVDWKCAITAKPWLSSGTLVDSRTVEMPQKIISKKSNLPELFACSSCDAPCTEKESYNKPGTSGRLCHLCFVSSGFWTTSEKTKASERIIDLLDTMAKNDDVYVSVSLLRKFTIERWPNDCLYRGQATLWIESATNTGGALKMKAKKTGKTAKQVICLARNAGWATAPWPDTTTDTTKVENYISDLLWERPMYSISRKELTDIIKKGFPIMMSTPLLRNHMFINAATKGSFFVAKCAYGQAVAMSREDAILALQHNFGEVAL